MEDSDIEVIVDVLHLIDDTKRGRKRKYPTLDEKGAHEIKIITQQYVKHHPDPVIRENRELRQAIGTEGMRLINRRKRIQRKKR